MGQLSFSYFSTSGKSSLLFMKTKLVSISLMIWVNPSRLILLFITSLMIAYSIFSLYRNTKIIHSIMMIWQNNFIESNYNWRRALRKILEEQRTYFHINEDIDSQSFLQKIRLLYPFAKEWYLYFHSLCFICHKKLCIFLPKKEKKIGMISVI